jgi:hypothetical protein
MRPHSTAHRKKQEVFFFEKKNQKTFAPALKPPSAWADFLPAPFALRTAPDTHTPWAHIETIS